MLVEFLNDFVPWVENDIAVNDFSGLLVDDFNPQLLVGTFVHFAHDSDPSPCITVRPRYTLATSGGTHT